MYFWIFHFNSKIISINFYEFSKNISISWFQWYLLWPKCLHKRLRHFSLKLRLLILMSLLIVCDQLSTYSSFHKWKFTVHFWTCVLHIEIKNQYSWLWRRILVKNTRTCVASSYISNTCIIDSYKVSGTNIRSDQYLPPSWCSSLITFYVLNSHRVEKRLHCLVS